MLPKRSLSRRWDTLRRSFWFLPAGAMLLGLALGLTIPEIDAAQSFSPGTSAFSFGDPQSARGILETIATVTVSVAGIAFSVTVVALALASQQLSPRVLRTFQANRLNQATLAVFVGTFVYCLVLLSSFGQQGVPKLSLTVAIVMAGAGFALFVWFIHDIVDSLQASTIIRRIARDGHNALASRYPGHVGDEPDDPHAAERSVREWMERSDPAEVRASRAGFLVQVEGDRVIRAARRSDALVVQRANVGDFAVTGAVLATAYCASHREGVGDRRAAKAREQHQLMEEISDAFKQEDERTVVQDLAFPIRQLADVALRALSPSLNDPTTAENAMGSLADTLVAFVRTARPSFIRTDELGVPRFVAAAPELDDLVRLGFEQVRLKAAPYPVLTRRLLLLLRQVDAEARSAGVECREVDRQARLMAEGVEGHVPTEADLEAVRASYDDFRQKW